MSFERNFSIAMLVAFFILLAEVLSICITSLFTGVGFPVIEVIVKLTTAIFLIVLALMFGR